MMEAQGRSVEFVKSWVQSGKGFFPDKVLIRREQSESRRVTAVPVKRVNTGVRALCLEATWIVCLAAPWGSDMRADVQRQSGWTLPWMPLKDTPLPAKLLFFHAALKSANAPLDCRQLSRCSGSVRPFRIPSFDGVNGIFNPSDQLVGIRFSQGRRVGFVPRMRYANNTTLSPQFARCHRHSCYHKICNSPHQA